MSGGTFAVMTADSLGDTAADTTVNAGGTLEILNVDIGTEAITLDAGTLAASGGTAGLVGGAVTLDATSTIDVGTGDALTVGGAIGGGGFGFIKTGDGTLVLGAANTHSGTTTISGGVIEAGVMDVLASSVVDIGAGLFFDMEGNDQTVAGLAGDGDVRNDVGGTVTVMLTIDGGSGAQFDGGFVEGPGVDANAVVKTGTGTQTFNVTGAYTGTTAIDDGTLSVMTADSLGDDVSATTVSGTGTLDLNGLALSNAEEIDITGSGSGGVGALTATGTSSISATNIVTLSGAVMIAGAGDLTINATLDGTDTAVTWDGTGTLDLAADNWATLTGAGSTITVADGIVVASDGGALGAITAGTTVEALGTLEIANVDIGTEAINLDGGMLAASGGTAGVVGGTVTLDASSTIDVAGGDALTINGAIGQSAALLGFTKSGDGRLTLTVANTYTGTTSIAAGTLELSGAGELGTGAGATTLDAATAVLELDGVTLTEDVEITVAGASILADTASTIDGASTITLTANGTLGTVADAQTLTVDAMITGGGDLTITGGGAAAMVEIGDGGNDYTGATNITAGILATTAVDVLDSSSGVDVGTGTTLDLSGNDQQVQAVSGDGDVTTTTTAELDVAGTSTFDGTLTGANLALRASGGTLTLTNGASDYGGQTNIDSGATIRIEAAGALGASAGVDDTGMAAGGTLELGYTTGTSNEDLNLAGTGVGGTEGALKGTETATFGGEITLAAGGATINVDGTGPVVLTISGDIVDGAGDALTKDGPDTLILSSVKSYTGTTTIGDGTLEAAVADILVNSSDLVLNDPGTFDMGGFSQTLTTVSGDGTVLSPSGTVTLTVDTSGGSSIFDGSIDQTGGTLSLTIDGGNTFTLGSGTSVINFAGATQIDGGSTLEAGTADIIASSSGLTIAASGTFDLNGNDQSVVSLDSTAATAVVDNNDDAGAAAAATLTITGTGGSYDGDIVESGNDPLSVAMDAGGGDSQTLDVDSGSYTGTTDVLGGTLVINSAASLGDPSGDVVIVAGVLDLAIAGGATLSDAFDIAGVSTAVGGLVVSTADTIVLDGGVTLTNDATIDVAMAGGNLTIDTNPIVSM